MGWLGMLPQGNYIPVHAKSIPLIIRWNVNQVLQRRLDVLMELNSFDRLPT